MSYAPVTRNGVENADPLPFPDKPARQDLTITVKAVVDGFPVEICYTGSVEQLQALTRKLRALGAEPTIAPAPAAVSVSKKAQKVEPVYQPDGTACCPVHLKPLQNGRYGLYCSAKARGDEAQNAKGYCSLTFAE
jgi:hypothetical protein